jgi:hypothetical protein
LEKLLEAIVKGRCVRYGRKRGEEGRLWFVRMMKEKEKEDEKS